MALTDKLKAIADAIRSKTGKTDKLSLDEMCTEIEKLTFVQEESNADESGSSSYENDY